MDQVGNEINWKKIGYDNFNQAKKPIYNVEPVNFKKFKAWQHNFGDNYRLIRI